MLTALAITGVLVLLAVGAARPAALLVTLREHVRLLHQAGVLVPTAALLVILPLLARRYLDVTAFVAALLLGTAGFVALYLLATRLHAPVARVVDWLDRRPVWQLAVGGALLSLVAGWVVFDGIPHVSDEVAYQFQAKALAHGHLSQPVPVPADAFEFTHTLIRNGRWFGIMNPGWPALLSAGYALHVPWLVNPVLGGVVLLLFHGFFREAGISARAGRLAVLLMAVSPFLLFMNGSYMSHTANLALFGAFCWSWARVLGRESRGAAVGAGLMLAANLLVRPVDTVAVALPFALQGLWHLRRRARLLPLFAVTTLVAASGVVLTLLYNRALMGDPTLMPVTEYFRARDPGQRFGMGFGADMGTTMHGAEWPGFYPGGAVLVSSYRASQLLMDLFALPLLPVAALVYAVRRRREWGEWYTVTVGAAASLVAVYFLHFYHGIAYGSRHLYLAVPAAMLLLARPVAEWLERGTPQTARRARALVAALIAATLLYAYPPLVREYGHRYRGVDGRVREAVAAAGLTDAVVFVAQARWGWKAAFPLNDYPLEGNRVLFARDRGPLNAAVKARFPGRRYHRLVLEPNGTATLTPL